MLKKLLKLGKKHWQYSLSVLLIAIIVVSGIVYFLRTPDTVKAEWWNDTWLYRQAITLTNSDTAQSNVQFKVLAGEDLSALVSAGKLQADLDDLRFTDIHGNLLPYWLEDNTAASVDAWAVIDYVPADGATVYMYYGNASAIGISRGTSINSSGGVITVDSTNYVHTFTSDGTFTSSADITAKVLVVAGGGGGGGSTAGGGGAGGVIYDSSYSINGQAYPITVGLGGDGSRISNNGDPDNTNGENSTFDTLIAIGGGYGFGGRPTGSRAASSGGSGGGAGYYSGNDIGVSSPGSGTSEQGFSGGTVTTNSNWGGAGGGGAGAAGNPNTNPSSTRGGGIGVQYDISGASTYYGGGGGGGVYASDSVSPGGLGGGGDGGSGSPTTAQSGTANTGGGGGGGGYYQSGPGGGDGGSGIVIISYAAVTSVTVGSPASEEQSEGPISYWKFDEGVDNTCTGGTNDVCDSASQSNDLALTGEPEWQTEDLCVSGKCLYFDGSSDYIDTNWGNGRNLTTDPFSVSMWVKPIAGTNAMYMASANGTSQRFYMAVYNDTWTMGVQGSGWSETAYPVATNQWSHVVAAADGSYVKVYVNGTYLFQKSYTSYALASDLAIGAQGPGGAYKLPSFVDEVKIFDYSLTAAQVKADYLAGLSGSSEGVGAALGGNTQNQSQGLVGYWKMDENTGTSFSDLSGSGNTVTMYNGPTWVAGQYGAGLNFDSVDDVAKVSTSSGDELNPADAISVSTWINITVAKNNAYAVAKGWGDNYQLTLNSNNTVTFTITNTPSSDSASASSSSTLDTGSWYLITGTYDRQNIKVYINGNLVGTTPYTKTIYQGSQSLGIGGIQHMQTAYPNYGINGKMDEVRIYNRALSAYEVRQLYKWAPGPIAYYNFEEDSGTTLYDKSGNGYNSTAFNGSPTWSIGKQGGGLYLDGTNDYISLPASIWSTMPDKVTLSIWIKGSNQNSGTSLFYANPSQKINVHAPWSSTIMYWDYGNACCTGRISKTMPSEWINDNWTHFAFTSNLEDSSMKIYANGVLWHSGSTTQDMTVAPTSFSLGAITDGTGKWRGYMDEFKIYDYERTPEQILQDMYGDQDVHPVGYWKFDEGYSTTAYDSGVLGYDGTLSCAGGTCSIPSWSNAGKFDKALYFSASSTDRSYVTASPINISSTTGEKMSWSMWLKPDASQTGNGWLMRNGTGSDENYSWRVGSASGGNHKLTLEIYDGAAWRTGTSATYAIPNNSWSHLTIIYSQGEWFDVYVNGEYIERTTLAYNSVQATSSFNIGGHSGTTGQYFDGYIDEVKVYNFALSEDQVRQEYNQGSQTVLSSPRNSSSTWDDGGFGGNAPIGYWNFEEGSGSTVYDKSANSNNGTITGSAYTLGKPGWGMEFYATDDYVSVPYNSALAPTSAVTVEAWVQLDNTTNNTRIVSKTEGGGYTLGTNVDSVTDQNFFVYRNGTYGKVGWDSSNYSIGTWYHFTGTYDGQYLKFYVNGQLKETDDAGSTYAITYAASNNLCIGIEAGGTTCTTTSDFDGKIDEVKVYNYARTQAQIAFDYNSGKPVGYWPLDDGEGITAIDTSGQGNAGTLTTMDPPNDWLSGSSCKYQGCLDFDGTSDQIVVTDTTILEPAQLTIMAWMKWDVISDQWMISKQVADPANYNYGYLIRGDTPSDTIMCRFGTGSGYQGVTGSITTAQWYHIACTYDGANTAMYIDGVEADTNSSGSAISYTSVGDLLIGGTTSRYHNGQMDDVRIYNYPLTAAQVKQVMNQGSMNFK